MALCSGHGADKQKRLGPPLASARAYKKLMTRYFYRPNWPPLVGDGRLVTSGGPVELLYAMGVVPFYPENHGAMCGATHVSADCANWPKTRATARPLLLRQTDLGSNIRSFRC
jgi:hypothetical protein